jgi:hypothetical protein
MKKLVTMLTLMTLILSAGSASAQVPNTVSGVPQQLLPAPELKAKLIPSAKALPLETPEEWLSFFDYNQTGERYIWEMPREIRYLRCEDCFDTIVGFSQRFTSTIYAAANIGPNSRKLDSLIIAYRAFEFDPSQRILIAVRRAQAPQAGDPNPQPRWFDWNNLIDSITVGYDDLVINPDREDGSYNYLALDMHNKSIPNWAGDRNRGEFFVSVHLWDQQRFTWTEPTLTQFALISDLNVEPNPGRAIDLEVDRSYIYTTNREFPDSIGVRTFQAFLGGRFINTSTEDVFYPNFEMFAKVIGIADVEDEAKVTLKLAQNYPNPFNPSTEIDYSVSDRAPVTLAVFNALGEQVALLVDEVKSPGTYSVMFDAKDLPTGAYHYVLSAGGQTVSKSMVLAK